MKNKPLILFAFVVMLLTALAAQNHAPLIDRPEAKIQDFAYYTALTNHFWRYNPGNLYSIDYQLEVYSKLFERPIDRPMPILWGPLTVFVLAPFLPLFPEQINLAHTIYVILSTGLFLLMSFFTASMFPALISAATLLTPVTLESLVLGQPSVLAAGLFGIMYFVPTLPFLTVLLPAIIISLKPTYLAPFFCILLAGKRWKTIFGIGIILLSLTLLVQELAGGGLISAYLYTLSMFRLDPIPPPYNRSYDPTLMANFAMFLKPYIGWVTAYKVTTACFALCQLIAVGLALRLPKERAWDLAPMVSAFGLLLFAPYVGWYEDILITPFLARLWQESRISKKWLIAFTILFFLLLSRKIYIDDFERGAFFLARTTMLVGVVVMMVKSCGERVLSVEARGKL